MVLKKIELHNWLCFKGHHSIELEPCFYKVIAKEEGNEERSNWLGKTAFLESILFAFFGTYRNKLDQEWITEGEKLGSVTLYLDDGTKITRSKSLNKSTHLLFVHNAWSLEQKEAQLEIEKLLAFNQEDFLTSFFLGQKKASHWVTTTSDARTQKVVSWLGLEAYQWAHKEILVELKAKLRVQKQLGDKIELLQNTIRDLKEEKFKESEDNLLLDYQSEKEEWDKAKKAYLKIKEYSVVQELYDSLVIKGQRIKKELEQIQLFPLEEYQDLKSKFEHKQLELQLSKDKLRSLQVNPDGNSWEGICPLLGKDCPVKVDVKRTIAQENEYTLAVKKKVMDLQIHVRTLERDLEDKLRPNKLYADKEKELQIFREQAREYKNQMDLLGMLKSQFTKSLDTFERDYDSFLDNYNHYQSLDKKVEYLSSSILIKEKELQEVFDQKKLVEDEVFLYKEAELILSKRGVQKTLAKELLDALSIRVNELLKFWNVAIKADFSYFRFKKIKGRKCEACGVSFAKFKLKDNMCPVCNRYQESNLIHQLKIVLSENSGAAEDLVGLAIQWAVTEMFQENRHVDFETFFLDEPLPHLDQYHWSRFADFLNAFVKGTSLFKQGFLALPKDAEFFEGLKTISIQKNKDGSRKIEVQA